MDFQARQYDPQLGRFLGIDPLAYSGGQQMYSPYAAMGNAPGEMIDPNGEMAKNEYLIEKPNAGHADVGWVDAGGFDIFGPPSGNDNYYHNTDNPGPSGPGPGGHSAVPVYDINADDKITNFNSDASPDVIIEIVNPNDLDGRKKELDPDNWIIGTFNNVKYEFQIIADQIKGNDAYGVQITLYVKAPAGYEDVDFIQTVEMTGDKIGPLKIDTDPKAPNEPYYFSKENRASIHKSKAQPNGYTHFFEDTPGPVTSTYRMSFNFSAELSLVGRVNGVYQSIITFRWGYFHSNNSAIPMPFYPTNVKSEFHQNAINSLNKR